MKTSLRKEKNMKILKICLFIIFMITSLDIRAVIPLPVYGAMNGIEIAFPIDTFVMVYNPAGIVYLDDRLDIGLAYMKRDDQVKIRDNGLIPHGLFKDKSDSF